MAGIGKYKGEGGFSMSSPLNASTNGGYAPFKMRGSPMQRNFGIGMQALAGDSPAKLAWFIPMLAKVGAGAAKVGAVVAKGAAAAAKGIAAAAKGAAGFVKGAAKGVAKGVSKVVSKGGIKGAVQKQTGKFASKISGGKVTKASQLFTKEGVKGVVKHQAKQIPGKIMESAEKTAQQKDVESAQARDIGAQTGQQFGEMKFTTGGKEEKTVTPTGKDDPTTPFKMKGFGGFGNSPAKAAKAPSERFDFSSGLGTLGSRTKHADYLRSQASIKTSLLRTPGGQWLTGKDKPTSEYGARK